MSLKPYRPSNGEEGERFRAAWCDRCEHESQYRASQTNGCEILAATFFLEPSDPDYPREWVWDPDALKRSGALSFGPEGARCTAFVPEAKP